MPLPHFLMLLALVIVAACLSLMAAIAVGVPLGVLGLAGVASALAAHLIARTSGGPHQSPGA